MLPDLAPIGEVGARTDAGARTEAGAPAGDLLPAGEPDWSTYGGRLLGANLLAPGLVELSLFAPKAKTVHAAGDFNSWSATATPLTKNAEGIWRAVVPIAKPEGVQYEFVLDGSVHVSDPYGKAAVQARGKSLITLGSYAWKDAAWKRPPRKDLVIYELNVSDFSSHASSGVDPALRGTYAGFEQKIPYLKQLGVNAVELMPIFEYCSDGYSWGYNTTFHFAPEAGLASSAHGAQVAELKHLVDVLHQAGIAVIVDAVYNHVDHTCNPLWQIDSVYYFDYDDNGDPVNDRLAWGDKVASWRPMVKKLIFDSLRYWMDAYHLDGFRLDSTENMDGPAVLEIIQALKDRGYGDRYFLFEEFSGPHNAAIQALNAKLGEVLVTSWGTGYKYELWEAVKKGAASAAKLGKVTYYSHDDGWSRPAEIVNYFSAHDEGTLSTRIGASKQQVKAAAVHLLMSMGLPMVWSGDELLRVHYGNYHPGGSKEAVKQANNTIDWSLASTNADLVAFYAGLIKLRLAHPALRLDLQGPDGSPDYFDWNTASWQSAVGAALKNVSKDNNFVVLVNFEAAAKDFNVSFPGGGTWYLMCDGKSATEKAPGLQTWTAPASGTLKVSVPAQSGYVFMSQQVNP